MITTNSQEEDWSTISRRRGSRRNRFKLIPSRFSLQTIPETVSEDEGNICSEDEHVDFTLRANGQSAPAKSSYFRKFAGVAPNTPSDDEKIKRSAGGCCSILLKLQNIKDKVS